MVALVTIEALAILLLGLLVAGLLRSHAEILRALDGLGVRIDGSSSTPGPVGPREPTGVRAAGGAAAIDVAGRSADDHPVALAVAGTRHDTLLAFLSSGCERCARFWSRWSDGDPHDGLPAGVRVVIVTRGPGQESPSAVRRLAPVDVPVVMSDDAWSDYGVPGAPYFVFVEGRSSRIAGEGSAATWSQLSSLMGQAFADRGPQPSEGRRAGTAGREARADEELRSAGILPGDPSLHAPTAP
jgi:hypothetical protein